MYCTYVQYVLLDLRKKRIDDKDDDDNDEEEMGEEEKIPPGWENKRERERGHEGMVLYMLRKDSWKRRADR